MSNKIKMYINNSNHVKLVPNARYSIKELHLITKIALSTLHNRMGYKDSFGDRELRQAEKPIVWPILESDSDKLSAKWLKRSIANV